ncbi:hypothetical protein [Mycobacterium sp.]|uniref:hypothetical protein n=1 Tax=Mycobacterium sp. TaxID=1785 RepID=UPI002C28C318|nr:hypothetical protein [Mycobacterium sp.]HME49261.1 hypothetical protein [Mycobacterium sp.]
MIRQLFIAGAIAGAAISTAPAAAADNGHYTSDVPGMNYDAALGAPCENTDRFVFGRGPGGEALACHWIPNQWPPVYTGFWVVSYPLYGVQQIGASCPGPQTAAQAPDGRPLLCLGDQGWQAGTLTGNGFFPG